MKKKLILGLAVSSVLGAIVGVVFHKHSKAKKEFGLEDEDGLDDFLDEEFFESDDIFSASEDEISEEDEDDFPYDEDDDDITIICDDFED